MSEYRDAKAQAKAERARAKAMRPWWKKKRFIFSGVILLIIVIAAAGAGSGPKDDGGSSSGDDNAATADSPRNNFSSNSEHPPEDDVEVMGCRKTVIDTVEVDFKVTNHSSKESDYTITLTIEDPSGAKVGDGYASTSNVDPGQVANVQGIATLSGKPASFTCQIEEVERFAS